jgi:anaerobic selenocysteine-containing dehydrogenase
MLVFNELGMLDRVSGTDFHDIYDIAKEQSSELDNLQIGGPGLCLRSDSPASADAQAPAAAPPIDDGLLYGWRVVHTFGCDTLGRMSPPSVELGPKPYVELHPSDAERLGIAPGDKVSVATTVGQFTGTAVLRSDLHPGVACAPINCHASDELVSVANSFAATEATATVPTPESQESLVEEKASESAGEPQPVSEPAVANSPSAKATPAQKTKSKTKGKRS